MPRPHAAKTNLSRLIERAQAGEEVIIARGDQPVAKLVPLLAAEPTGSSQLPAKVVKALRKEQVDAYVSPASAWEIAMKVRIGKLTWPPEAGSVTAYAMSQGFSPLPITLAHAERAGSLAIEHRDPFDRMLIAQAVMEDLLLVSNESIFDAAGVRRYW